MTTTKILNTLSLGALLAAMFSSVDPVVSYLLIGHIILRLAQLVIRTPQENIAWHREVADKLEEIERLKGNL